MPVSDGREGLDAEEVSAEKLVLDLPCLQSRQCSRPTQNMTTKSKGQGLGLAVVKRIIEALNGKISFESQEEKGTIFKIELPFSN